MTAPRPWLATVTYRDGTLAQQRCTTREHAEAGRDAQLDRGREHVTSHALIHITQPSSDISEN